MQGLPAIQFENISKQFGKGRAVFHAVKNLTLEVSPGQVYGFLGPNGAGKTTTIRMIMALIHPTRGNIRVYGQDVQKHPGVLKKVGALVEGPAFYSYMSGRDNLQVIGRTANDYHPERIELLLKQVGLEQHAKNRIDTYSLGMRQRLGIAAALLGDPDLVILDEPTNGLDPAGIQEMRQFIRSLAKNEGKTVFVSSHLLNEVEQICDRVAIIHKGELIREGAVVELVSARAKLHIQASPVEKVIEVLSGEWSTLVEDEKIVIDARRQDAPHIIRRLAENGVDVYEVSFERQSLEEYFMEVTQR
jgi:ABC-2 type transport system ATP-binding protein